METPFSGSPDRVQEVLSRLEHVRAAAGGWVARCPSHNDKVQSLKIDIARDDGRILMFCHAGCDTRNIVDALGMSMSDLFSSPQPEKGPKIVPLAQKIDTIYNYTDENGDLVLQVVRYTPKTFRQRRPDGRGGWIWNVSGVEPPLYRLPELLSSDQRKIVFVCAGEKDADRLASLGLIATTNPMGEGKGKWKPWHTEALRNRRVVVVCDNDKTGRERGDELGHALTGVAKSVRILSFPDLLDHGDVSDWLDAGRGRSELVEAAKLAPEWVDPNSIAPDAKNPTDTGNAKRLIERHGKNLRYVYAFKSWMTWDGARWVRDQTGEIERLASETVRHIYEEASEAEDSAERKKIAAHAMRSESTKAMRDMIAKAQHMAATPTDAFDLDPWLFNVKNGTIDLRDGSFREHRRNDLITKTTPVRFDPNASCPTWERFMDTIMAGNVSLIEFIQKSLGYSLSAIANERVIFILYGTGKNGKSTLIEVAKSIMGDYALRSPSELLIQSRNAMVPADLARLVGVRFTFVSETSEDAPFNEARVKDMVSGDTQSARFMRENYFDFKPQFKVWLATNHRPIIRQSDQAIWDRIRLIPFDVRIPDDQVDTNLQSKLLSESSGILNWMIDGCLAWQREGLGVPREIEAAVSGYRSDMDIIKSFMDEFIVHDPVGSITNETLWTMFSRWLKESNERDMTQNKFSRSMKERGYIQMLGMVNGKKQRQWLGIRERTGMDL